MGIRALREAGIEYRTEYGSKKKRKVTNIRLRWPAIWWADVCNKEGQYLPSCCGNISGIRDELVQALREDGWISTEDLATCFYTLKDHGCDGKLFANDGRGKGPVAHLIRTWNMVKDVAQIRQPKHGLDPRDLKDAIHIVSSGTLQLDFEGLFDNGPDKCPEYTDRVKRATLLARMIPAMHTLYNRLAEKALGDSFEGIAVVSRKHPEEVIQTTNGKLAVFADQAASEEIVKRSERANPKARQTFRLRRVRVTVASGLTFLDTPAEQSAS